jgi:hypothetical protein
MNFDGDEEYLREHRNRVYLKIRANLPGDFEQFSHEMLIEMIFDTYRGYAISKLRADLIEKYKESPRDFMLDTKRYPCAECGGGLCELHDS